MIVHLHACSWNEERLLPFFFRHYDPIVDHYFIHDNQSTDRSLEILAAHPRVTVLTFGSEGESFNETHRDIMNETWKASRGKADWVAICDMDEFFWHPDLLWYLQACRRRRITFLPSTGFHIITDEFPEPTENLALTRRQGARHPPLDKISFFNPEAITETGFSTGRHKAKPTGRVVYPKRNDIQLLHYKFLGLDYVNTRHAELKPRMRERDREFNWGFHYDAEFTRKQFARIRSRAREVLPPAAPVGDSRWRNLSRNFPWSNSLPRPATTASPGP